MQIRRRDIFTTVRTEGGLLPADLLQRIVSGQKGLEGLAPESYHLAPGEKLNERINRSWNRLLGLWEAFRAAEEKLPHNDPGTGVTRERWLLPLFQELDYGRLRPAPAIELSGKSYAISHAWGPAPIHLVGCRVDLDRPAKGVAGAARSSPHSLTQELLNRSDDHLWAFVSNGKRLRILRDNKSLTRQSYVEFDLEAMLEGEVYADFVLFWLLCHQSRVEAERPEPCWLEKWSQAAQEQGTRALDQLRVGVEQAISALGSGFLSHPANRCLKENLRSGALDRQEYYRQLLRMVYRLLFLFVAEDRELLLNPDAPHEARDRYLRYYATTRLRRLSERQRGTRHSDLYHSLRLVIDHLYAGCPELGVPALGSFLFSPQATPALEGCDIANADLLAAIRALAFTLYGSLRRPVDYRNLRSEELGSIYEALLELHPEMNVDAGTFKLRSAGGSDRKTTGSYYTPDSLVQCLLDTALDPVVDEAVKKPNPEQAILDLKVCDPACGSGHFLIAAAHRMAKRLASVRTGDEEPSPEATRKALRDVIGRCLYGVDLNPMAVELCKVALWMEALEPGRPLSFLDHHVQCGNSLLGATRALIDDGIPDAAFNPIEGDDKAVCAEFKRKNKEEREGQGALFDANLQPWERLGDLAAGVMQLYAVPDDTLAGVRQRQQQYESLMRSQGYENGRLLADAWCAAFVWKKARENGHFPLTTAHLRRIVQSPHSIGWWMRQEIERLARQYQFFHWHLAFPDVFQTEGEPGWTRAPEEAVSGWSCGFDVMLGNPPWERIKLQEKEWFAVRNPVIANAANASKRQTMIAALKVADRALYDAFQDDRRRSEGESHLLRRSGRYPLCGRGDVNTYAVFSELFLRLLCTGGRAGVIVPTAVATDDTTKYYFQDVVDSGSLVSLYDFQSGPGLFSEVGHARFKFCLLTLRAQRTDVDMTDAKLAFFLRNVEHLKDSNRCFTLSAADIALLNPNTRTCPIFRTQRDAEITKGIYHRVPVLINEADSMNLWGASFTRMFDMSNDSELFRTREELDGAGGNLDANEWVVPTTLTVNGQEIESGRYMPLYEAKLFHQYDHRFASYASSSTDASLLTVEDKQNPATVVLPRYWVHEREVSDRINRDKYGGGGEDHARQSGSSHEEPTSERSSARSYHSGRSATRRPLSVSDLDVDCSAHYKRDQPQNGDIFNHPSNCAGAQGSAAGIWLAAFRKTARSTDQRTVIASMMPISAMSDRAPLYNVNSPASAAIITSMLNSYVLDYVARTAVGGTDLSFFILKQLPILPPAEFTVPCRWDRLVLVGNWIAIRVVELTYTADDMQPFARDCGYDGSPFLWDEERRFLLRCELDALYFHLYGIVRDDVDYIMETFPIVKRKDEAEYGEYRTKRVILEIYDAMLRAQETGVPYQTRLDPPPARGWAPPDELLLAAFGSAPASTVTATLPTAPVPAEPEEFVLVAPPSAPEPMRDKDGEMLVVRVYSTDDEVILARGVAVGRKKVGEVTTWSVLAEGETTPRQYESPPVVLRRIRPKG